MNKRTLILQLVSLPLLLMGVIGCSTFSKSIPAVSADNPLLQSLTSSIGLDAKQVTGGVGSMLSLASNKLASGDFDQIAQYIPGADAYLATAKQLVGNVGSLAELNSAFSKLGISPGDATKMVSGVTDFVGQAGGESAAQLLANALK